MSYMRLKWLNDKEAIRVNQHVPAGAKRVWLIQDLKGVWLRGPEHKSKVEFIKIWGTLSGYEILCVQEPRVCVLRYVWLFATPWTVALQALRPWNFPGKNTGAGCHFQLQVIFLTQGLNLVFFCLLHWQADSSTLCHLGSLARMLGDDKHPSARLASINLKKIIACSEQNQKA